MRWGGFCITENYDGERMHYDCYDEISSFYFPSPPPPFWRSFWHDKLVDIEHVWMV